MNTGHNQTFGQRIRELRQGAGLSQRALSDLVGINFTYLSKIENNVLPAPGVDVIIKLAEALSADKDELLTLAGKVPSEIASELLNNPAMLKSLRNGKIGKRDRKYQRGSGTFGELLRKLREDAGLSQSELADMIGISFTYLSKIETGVKSAPSQKVIIRLAEVLKADTDEMLMAAGKVPVDIINSLKDRDTLQVVKRNIYNERKNTARRSRVMEVFKSFFTYKQLSRVALPILLVVAVAGSLWFGTPTPTKALQMQINNQATGYTNLPYTFSVTVDIETGELLPIDSVDLTITNGNQIASFTALPLIDGANKLYTGAGGAANITAYAPGLSVSYGTGYVLQGGYIFDTPADGFTGPASITYTVIWVPPVSWPTGTYTIETAISAQSQTFTETSNFQLAQASMMAITSVSEALDSLGAAVVSVYIDDVVDSSGIPVDLSGGLGSYIAQIVLPNDGIQIVGVNGTAEAGPVSFDSATGIFSVASIASPMQPNHTKLADIVVRLTGNITVPNSIGVVFTNISSVNEPTVNVPQTEPSIMSFLRGDSNRSGDLGVGDALFIAQYLVGQKTYSEIGAVNGACVTHDQSYGDLVGVGDALFIAQNIVGQKDAYFNAK